MEKQRYYREPDIAYYGRSTKANINPIYEFEDDCEAHISRIYDKASHEPQRSPQILYPQRTHRREYMGPNQIDSRKKEMHTPDKEANRTNSLLIILVLIVMGIVIAIPLTVLYVFKAEGKVITEGNITIEFKLAEQFEADMQDGSSEMYESMEKEICKEVSSSFLSQSSVLREYYQHCLLLSLRNGSIDVEILITFIGTFDTPENRQYEDILGGHVGNAFGQFTLVAGSLRVSKVLYKTKGVITNGSTLVATTITTEETTTPTVTTTTQPTASTAPTTTTTAATTTTTPLLPPVTTTTGKTTTRVTTTRRSTNTTVPTTITTTSATTTTTPFLPRVTTTKKTTTEVTTPTQSTTSTVPPTTTTAATTTTTSFLPPVTTTTEKTSNVTTTTQSTTSTVPTTTTTAATTTTTPFLPQVTTTTEKTTSKVTTTTQPTASKVPTTTTTPFLPNVTTTTEKTTTKVTNTTQPTTLTAPATTSTTAATTTTTPFLPPALEMDSSITKSSEKLSIVCKVYNAPLDWTELIVKSLDNDIIHAVWCANGSSLNYSYTYLVSFEAVERNLSLGIHFTNTSTTCQARGNYICNLHREENTSINTTATVSITDDAINVQLLGKTQHTEGDRYDLNCTGTISAEGGDLNLYTKASNGTVYIMSEATPTSVKEVIDGDGCYSSVTKTYSFIARKDDNGTQVMCIAANNILTSNVSTESFLVQILFADFSATFHLENATWNPAFSDPNSPEFKEFAEEIESDTDYVFRQSRIRDNFNSSKVISLEPGSVIAIISVIIDLTVNNIDSEDNVVTAIMNNIDIEEAFTESLTSITVQLQLQNSNSSLLALNTGRFQGSTHDQTDFELCTSKTDLVFLLDASGSIGLTNFLLMKTFIRNFTATVSIGKDSLQISVVKFSSDVTNEFFLNEYDSAVKIVTRTNDIIYTNGGTQIGRGLNYVRSNSFLNESGGRPDAEKVIILMTDGKSSDQSDAAANLLRSESVIILCIGIGNGINVAQLQSIAYNESFVYSVTNFDLLINIKEVVQKSSCEVNKNV